MNGNAEELTRPRPQSAGIWTLFSWLRRSEHSSSESISSVGSDRTAASFDFLAPLQYGLNNPPLILPSSPPTDTYKKRLHERNLRRLQDRDISIHRKYGLLRVDEARCDTFNLTSKCSNESSYCTSRQGLREKRAASECLHRRAAYVPGKRRAPQPPLPVVAVTLPRSYKRKRPAPKPPAAAIEDKENFEINQFLRMNTKNRVDRDTRLIRSTSNVEKSDFRNVPEHSKDKSFLKQIFVNRKRTSAVGTSHIKLLPSISELDKQALEIIERKKALKATDTPYKNLMSNSERSNDNVWICTSCLRRYTAIVITCAYCETVKKHTKQISMDVSNIQTQTDAHASVSKSNDNDKEKLKEMLKEMKDSLPKRSKHDKNKNDKIITETSTLRIGSDITETTKNNNSVKPKYSSNVFIKTVSDKGQELRDIKMSHDKEKFLNTQPSSSTFVNTAKINKTSTKSPSEDISLIVSTNSFVQSIKSETSNNALINSNAGPLNIKNNDKVPMKIKNVDDDGNRIYTEIINHDIKSSESKNVKTQPRKIDFSIENNNQSEITLPSRTQIIKHTSTVNETKANSQLSHSNDNDMTKTVSSIPSQQKEKAYVVENSAVNGKKIHAQNLNSSINTICTEGTKSSMDLNKYNPLHTPLKISSLLNPIYSPKHNSSDIQVQKKTKDTTSIPGCSLPELPKSYPTESILNDGEITKTEQNLKLPTNVQQEVFMDILRPTATSAEKTSEPFNPYSRRRILINQLEQSISKGDEKTAADVAAKLAKLKLSCSVLSFSSQIVADSALMLKNIENLSNRRPDIIKDIGDPINKTGESITKPVNSSKRKDFEMVENNDNLNNNNDRNVRKQERPSTYGLKPNEHVVPIEVWIEDKETTRGPIRLRVIRESTMKELMQQAETSLGLAIHLQRWIVGKTLCTDNNVALSALAGPNLASPFYLCLVESDIVKKETSTAVKTAESNHKNIAQTKINNANTDTDGVYTELMRLEMEALVPNLEPFECVVCMENRATGEGIILRECLHIFCRECLADAIRHCEEPVVSCPEVDCSGTLLEREVRALLSSEEYEKWLARSLTAAECGTRNTFHCRTRDCKGWAFCEPGVRKFPCPICKCINCVECQAVHEGETCKQHQEKIQKAVPDGENNQTDEGTKALLNSLISRGEALECPECRAIITKKWGCDWVKCSACKTEICWVTRGRRWGPAGRGDTSAGCRCGVDGQRCHPSCGYCH